jgi:hypothetical protein
MRLIEENDIKEMEATERDEEEGKKFFFNKGKLFLQRDEREREGGGFL